jgi:hypothetical protein
MGSHLTLQDSPSSYPRLTVQPDQDNHAEDDRGEKNLYDMIVEDLLIGVGRRVERSMFLLTRYFRGNAGLRSGCVLSGVHV